MTIKASYPTIEPTLSLDFANSKRLDPRMTFTRNSVGTYFDAAGVLRTAAVNEPRFDHNPATGESLGLLVEEARTNLLLRSEEFDNATWMKLGVLAFGSGSVANAITAPNGAATADLLVEDTANGQHNIRQDSSTTGAKRFSVFAKQGAGTRVLRLIDYNATDGAQGETFFNLSTGTIVAGTGEIQALPNGWYRCSIQSTTTVASTYYISFAINPTTFSYAGDGASSFYLWGAQLEAGAFPTSYIKTEGSTVPRQADTAVMTGTNFSSWYRETEGTIFCNAKEYPFASAATSRVFYGFDNSSQVNSDWIRQWIWNGNTALISNSAYTSNSGPVATDLSFSFSNVQKRSAFAYRTNDFSRSYNGGTPGVDTSGNLPVGINRFGIGSTNNSLHLNGHIRSILYWNTRLPDATLQALTAA